MIDLYMELFNRTLISLRTSLLNRFDSIIINTNNTIDRM